MLNGTPTIKKTTNYQDFKTVKGNRLLNQDHYRNLLRQINKRNLLHLNPIVVNEAMEVIDGQHRLAVAKSLAVPIFYVQEKGLDFQDVIMFNTTVKDWCIDDYTKAYMALGFSEYVKLDKFKRKHGLSSSNAIAILTGEGKIGKASYKRFKAGLFEVQDIDWAETFANCLHDIVPFTSENTWKDRDFIRALSLVYSKGIKHETLMERLQRYGGLIYRRPTITEYLRLFEDVYNKGVSQSNQYRFY